MKRALFVVGIAVTTVSACKSNGGGTFKTSSSMPSGEGSFNTSLPMLAKGHANLTFTTVDSGDWAVVTHASGKATASKGSITLRLNDFTTLANPEIPAHILGYRVCIAYKQSPSAWGMAACSNLVKHRVTMEPRQSETLDPNTVVIPASELSELGPFWLAIDVEVAGPNQVVGHNFAHSEILH